MKKKYRFDLKNKRVWVAGHNGMVGKAILMHEEGKLKPISYNPTEGKKWYRMHSYFQNRVEKN